ncbi:MAG: hypothetical protein IJ519_03575 [Clostridia bacterium]|nr:hypothetical protein [Clostridia bacterium]
MKLEELYEGRRVFHGEMHDHSQSGGTSDGKRPLSHWLGAMEALKLDFAAILDHRQVRHMFEPEWEDGVFIGGTEPAALISDSTAEKKWLHYLLIFEGPEPVMKLLEDYPRYGFTGGREGHFDYPEFTRAEFGELAEYVREHGGFFVHPHPKQCMISDDPLQYWFADYTGIEVFYGSYETKWTEENYALWCELLRLGKRVWACAGGDWHACASDGAITTFYATEKKNSAYLEPLRRGDFVCGGVGIRMAIGDTLMGGSCSFAGKELRVCISDFHKSVYHPEHTYRADVITDNGVVYSTPITCTEPAYISLDTEDCAFYRVEIFDTLRDKRIAIGNPIWNDR